jgi:hypothetical protein
LWGGLKWKGKGDSPGVLVKDRDRSANVKSLGNGS